ncbi:MAG: SDR family oxidoreductase [Planctomycetaceae bacterium]|nr:SDR family oxidoreductase [Planctomycetaceae bacterium]
MPDSKIFASLAGRRALVTGASHGIGKAIALAFAAAGADVLVHCRKSVDAAQDVAREARAAGVRSDVLLADVSRPADCARLVDEAWQQFGSLDVWVNNAGADILTTDARTASYDDRLQLLFETDVRGTMLLSRLIGDRMRGTGADAGDRAILTIGWDQADRGMEGESGELFAATKNAIMGFTRSLSLSLAPDVRVNCIAPGWIRTAWGESASDPWQERVLRETPLRRWGTPQDIAALARFLCSSDASYLTGQVINANGGAVR